MLAPFVIILSLQSVSTFEDNEISSHSVNALNERIQYVIDVLPLKIEEAVNAIEAEFRRKILLRRSQAMSTTMGALLTIYAGKL